MHTYSVLYFLLRMLVNMGDLPQPEQNVLSQRVWSPMPLARAGSVGSAGFGSSSTGQQMGMNTNTISSSIGGGGGDGYYPPVPPPPPRADSSAAATTATAEGMGHGKRAEVSGGGEGADGDDGNMSKRMKH